MEVRAEQQGSAMVLSLEGSLTVEADTSRLHELVGLTSSLDTSALLLDLGQVRRLDSYGVGQLVAIYNTARPRGIVLVLVNVERHQKRLLEVAGLLTVFPIFDTREEALTRHGHPVVPQPGSRCTPLRDAA